MSTLIMVLHVIVCLFLMLTVLLQSGKGGGMGAAFGGGNAATVFGGSGASGFLKKLTAIAGTIFMLTSISLAYLSSKAGKDSLSSFDEEQAEQARKKEEAKLDALKRSAATGSAAPATGSAAPATGSAAPAIGSAALPATGSAALPAGSAGSAGSAPAPEQPVPAPGSGSATTAPAAPAPATGSGSAAPGSGS